MRRIPREVKQNEVVTWSKEIRERQKLLSIDDNQKQVLIGTILGDGCLTPNSYGKNVRLQIDHCANQKEYVFWKSEVFKDWRISEPSYNASTDSWRFKTLSHPKLAEYRELFYLDRKKIIPTNVGELLTSPLSLAVWFMDDGAIARRQKGYILNTQNFTRSEIEGLVSCLESNFGLNNLSLHRDRTYWRIYVRKDSTSHFRDLIFPYIIPSMMYKVLF